ncbi:HAD family hydrolase [Nocardioides sp. URHA0020]|uniref:HAD family hydrolase n=1 Tax=Nocardioides sp. URHA0020 TaxID=1380392 RepID=UPI00048E8ECC|nr:HAD family phosphatase [Nocardioides sp. URHA0020]
MRPDHHDPSAPNLDEVTTLLCDADGNLFPSEEPAFDASVGVTNRFLSALGSSRAYTADELRRASLGRNFRRLATDLSHELGTRVSSAELQAWVDEEAAVVTRHLATVLAPDEAVTSTLSALASRYRLAVVSSSATPRLAACFTATGLDDLFPVADRFSAQDSLATPTSKPDPAVYTHALRSLALDAREAVAVEDAVAGVSAAVGAGIATIGNLAFVPALERPRREQQLLAAGAWQVVTDWQELRDLMTSTAGAARS